MAITADDGSEIYLSKLDDSGITGKKICLSEHCYCCTAGEGSSCTGSLLPPKGVDNACRVAINLFHAGNESKQTGTSNCFAVTKIRRTAPKHDKLTVQKTSSPFLSRAPLKCKKGLQSKL
jgi:hypothetical protein